MHHKGKSAWGRLAAFNEKRTNPMKSLMIIALVGFMAAANTAAAKTGTWHRFPEYDIGNAGRATSDQKTEPCPIAMGQPCPLMQDGNPCPMESDQPCIRDKSAETAKPCPMMGR